MAYLAFLSHTDDPPTDVFAIMDNDEQVGTCELRHCLYKGAEPPAGFEGHIAYEVLPEHRGKGYAKAALRLLCDKAREHGSTELRLTIKDENIASRKVAESCGAMSTKTAPSPTSGKLYHLYILQL